MVPCMLQKWLPSLKASLFFTSLTTWLVQVCNNHFSQSSQFPMDKILSRSAFFIEQILNKHFIHNTFYSKMYYKHHFLLGCEHAPPHTPVFNGLLFRTSFAEVHPSMCFGFNKVLWPVLHESALSYISMFKVFTEHVASMILPADGDCITLWKSVGKHLLCVECFTRLS